MKCPRCRGDAEGRFCGHCGAALETRRCPSCASSVPPGYRFCSSCGAEQGGRLEERSPAPSRATPERVAAATGGGGGEGASADGRRWWIAGGAVAGAVVFLTLPYVWTGWAEGVNGERIPVAAPASPPVGSPGAPPPGGTAPGVDLSSMTPREAADRLFNRVMTALGEGDQQEVESFLPMAIDAYRLVPDLDADGHFHLSLLQQAGGDHRAGLETAERVLDSDPDHLLALYAAGEAARELGEEARAGEHFGRLLEVFEVESARDLPEYEEHESFLPVIRDTAQDFLATSGSYD